MGELELLVISKKELKDATIGSDTKKAILKTLDEIAERYLDPERYNRIEAFGRGAMAVGFTALSTAMVYGLWGLVPNDVHDVIFKGIALSPLVFMIYMVDETLTSDIILDYIMRRDGRRIKRFVEEYRQ